MKINYVFFEKIILILSVLFIYLFNYNITNGIYKFTNVFIFLFIFVELIDILKCKKIKIIKYTYSIFIFFIICLISLLYTFSFALSISKIKTLVVLVLYFLSLFSFIIKDKNNLKFLLKVLIIVNIIGCIYTIILSDWLNGIRTNGIVGDANQAGAYFAYSCTISIYYLYFYKSSRLFKLFCIISVILSIFVNVIGGSRSALISTVFGLILFFLLKERRFFKILKNVFLAILLLLLVYKIVNEVPVLYKIIGIRFDSMFEIINGQHSSINESSIDTRFLLIKHAYNLFTRNLFTIFLGNGIGSFQEYSRLYLNFDAFSHNNYFELLSGVGLLGFISYYYSYFLIFIRSLKKFFIKKDKSFIVLIVLILQMFISHFFVVFYYQKLEFLFLSIIFGIFFYCMNFTTNN